MHPSRGLRAHGPRSGARAVRDADGRLTLLDPLDVPTGTVVAVSVEVPEGAGPEGAGRALRSWRLGVRRPVTRDAIYGEG
jgi:hypothetical protein